MRSVDFSYPTDGMMPLKTSQYLPFASRVPSVQPKLSGLLASGKYC